MSGVKRYISTHILPGAGDWNSSVAPHTYVHAADYDRLEQECVTHKNTAKGANNQLNANRLETEKLAKDWLAAVEARDAALKQVEGLRAALAKAALAMWNSESNMDNEAADAEEALAGTALQEPKL